MTCKTNDVEFQQKETIHYIKDSIMKYFLNVIKSFLGTFYAQGSGFLGKYKWKKYIMIFILKVFKVM